MSLLMFMQRSSLFLTLFLHVSPKIFSKPPTFALGDHITAKHLVFLGCGTLKTMSVV